VKVRRAIAPPTAISDCFASFPAELEKFANNHQRTSSNTVSHSTLGTSLFNRVLDLSAALWWYIVGGRYNDGVDLIIY
jgi:hypothetical protein